MYDRLIGQSRLFSGVTYFTLGKVTEIVGPWAILNTASWVGETGKLADCIKDGSIEESEYLGDDVWVNLDTCTDHLPWAHKLPTVNRP